MSMQPTIGLRPETPADAPFLFQLYSSTRTEELKLAPWNDVQKEAFLRMQFDAQTRHYRQYYSEASFDLVLLDSLTIGRLYVYRTSSDIQLIDVALLPGHRGRGIGGQLIGTLLTEASAEAKPIRIHVEQNNPARRLYARLGFTKIETRGIYDFMECLPKENSRGADASP